MNILLLLAHAIEEHDQLRLLRSLGHDVWSIGSYIGGPVAPHDPTRPALPDLLPHDDLRALVDALPGEDKMDAAKRHLPDAIIEWADTIIVHHYEHTWLVPQWDRIKHKRIIWRTVGQSVEGNERMMAPLRSEGLQIVRYSPKERNIPGYAGEDALIRFYKDPADWYGWTGEDARVINITQHLRQRDPFTNWRFWEAATAGMPRVALGPGSEEIGGPGGLTYDAMREWLRRGRVYLYTGTQPASYTLGLIEAMMTGIPVVSIGPVWMHVFPYGPDLFEGHELAGDWADTPSGARQLIRSYMGSDQRPDSPHPTIDTWAAGITYERAKQRSAEIRAHAIDLFGIDTIRAQWDAFLR